MNSTATTPPTKSSGTLPTAAVPGLLLSGVVAVLCMVVNAWIPLLSALLLAIIAGVVARNAHLIPTGAELGIKQSWVLRLGVVLLGLKLSIPTVLSLGVGALIVIAATVVLTYAATLALGRALDLPRQSSVLIATGCAICGAAAVAAVSSVLPRRSEAEAEQVEESAATAVATVTLFGTLSLLLVPVLASLFSLTTSETGVWIGASVHEVGQVVAAAGLAGTGVTTTAVVTKLGRVVLLAPLVAFIGWTESRRVREAGEGVRVPVLPWFVAAFVAMVALRSLVPFSPPVLSWADKLATFLLTMGMFSMGAGVHLRRLWATGGRALALGALAGVVSAAVSLVMVLLTHL